jgi:intraflagellar transport protein 122
MSLGAYKLARHAYDRLARLQLPAAKAAEVELDLLVVQAKHVRDNPDLLPVCYRCSATNPLLNPFTSKFAKADVCNNCGEGTDTHSLIHTHSLTLITRVQQLR